MDDRELLELAAKAAGIEWIPSETDAGKECDLKFGLWLRIEGEPTEFTRRRFNPLTDDADAFRLAVKLGLNVPTKWEHARMEAHGLDVYAATRRAIVRAAAQIGAES